MIQVTKTPGLKPGQQRRSGELPTAPLISRLLFRNGIRLSTNLKFWRYLKDCQRAYARRNRGTFLSAAVVVARRIQSEGYCVFPPAPDSRTVTNIAARVARLVEAGHATITPGVEEWMVQVNDSMATVPEITGLLRPEVVTVLEAAYRSHFKIFSTEIYRVLPTTERMQVSGLWHTDNLPPGMLKALVYLTDSGKPTGALRLHPWPKSRRLLRAGFFDRFNARRFSDALESSWIFVDGPAGTVILWDSNIVHRTTPPEFGYRDAVAFKFLPSLEPWEQHVKRMGGLLSYERRRKFPDDPAED